MAYLDWRNDYSVGIASIDEQHKKLVGLLNDLFDSMSSGKGKEALNTVLTSLIQYTQYHFKTEEDLMKLHRYPEYEEHKQKHDKLAEHVVNLKKQFSAGQITSPVQITNFLKDWLSKHIMGTDMKYGPFLRAKGVK